MEKIKITNELATSIMENLNYIYVSIQLGKLYNRGYKISNEKDLYAVALSVEDKSKEKFLELLSGIEKECHIEFDIEDDKEEVLSRCEHINRIDDRIRENCDDVAMEYWLTIGPPDGITEEYINARDKEKCELYEYLMDKEKYDEWLAVVDTINEYILAETDDEIISKS